MRALEPCPPRPVRYVGHTGPGHDLRTAVASDQLQSRQPGARRRHRPRSADPSGGRRDSAPLPPISSRATASSRSRPNPSRNVAYGDLIGGQRFNLQLDQAAARKHPREWTVLGTPVPRVDMRDMVTGRFEFVHNVKVPGMLHGRVVRPPEVGATVGSVDEELDPRASRNREGGRQRQLRRRRRAEAVAGDARRRAPQGELDARHAAVAARRSVFGASKAAGARHAARRLRRCRRQAGGGVHGSEGRRITIPYQMHALDGQFVRRCRRPGRQGHALVGDAVGVSDAQYVGDAARPQAGERSRRSTCAAPAATGSTARTRSPTTPPCSRRRSAGPSACNCRARTKWRGRTTATPSSSTSASRSTASGNISVWDYEAWSAARGGRPGYNTPGNVVTGFLVGSSPAPFAPRTPAPAPDTPLEQRFQHGAVVHRRARSRFGSRRRRDSQRARAVAPRAVAVLHRPAART